MVNVEWRQWGAAAFARARQERKPVLLSIAAAWSHGSSDMDATSYADPGTAAFINHHFIAIRVDADERPDIAERYTLGGIPTTAFLDADGAILGGGTHVPPRRLRAVLEQASAVYAGGAGRDFSLAATHSTAPGPGFSLAATVADVTTNVFSSFDADHGGFGAAPKFPLVAPLHLALELWSETHDPRWERMVVTSLDAMGWGGLYDETDGGFFECAARPDWTAPSREKLLATNAALIRLYLDAGATMGAARFTERAADALHFVQARLAATHDGGWFPSEAHAGGPQLVDAAAAMARAALLAARVFDDEGLRQFALTSLERVLLSGYKPGHGAAHVVDGPAVRGLLTDQAATIAASLDAFDLTGNVVYQMMAEELAHYALRVMGDERDGGFFDAVEDEHAVGLLRTRLKPFVLNCDMATALAQLARTSGETTFLDRAREAVAAMAPLALEQGPLGAHWVLALRATRG